MFFINLRLKKKNKKKCKCNFKIEFISIKIKIQIFLSSKKQGIENIKNNHNFLDNFISEKLLI